MNMDIFNGIKVVLWDIDGTILNFAPAQEAAIRTLFDEFGLGDISAEMLEAYDEINHGYWRALERGEVTKSQVLTGRFYDFFKKYDLDTNIVEAFNDQYQIRLGDTICLYDGVMELIRLLKDKGFVQMAVTNGTKVAQQKKLSRSGLDALFDDVFISEDVGFEKPNPHFFEPVYKKICELAGDVNLSEILIIGDSLTSDIQLGVNVGIKTCWFRHPDQKDSTINVDYEIVDYEIS